MSGIIGDLSRKYHGFYIRQHKCQQQMLKLTTDNYIKDGGTFLFFRTAMTPFYFFYLIACYCHGVGGFLTLEFLPNKSFHMAENFHMSYFFPLFDRLGIS